MTVAASYRLVTLPSSSLVASTNSKPVDGPENRILKKKEVRITYCGCLSGALFATERPDPDMKADRIHPAVKSSKNSTQLCPHPSTHSARPSQKIRSRAAEPKIGAVEWNQGWQPQNIWQRVVKNVHA